MSCNEVSLVDVVRALDGLITEAQMRDGDTAGLLRVILEVSLDILVGVVTDDLCRILICSDSTVAADTPELTLNRAGCGGDGCGLLLGKRKTGNIINNTDGEALLGISLLELFVDSEYGRRRSIL